MVVIALALALQGFPDEQQANRERPESSTSLDLRYLARHQRPDGSWGERPDGCTCPNEKQIVACDREKIAPLLRALGDEDPGKRDAAERELRTLGESAVPHLLVLLGDRDPEVRGRCARLCRPFDLAARGGGDSELTALALLDLLAAGYSPLSKDETDGCCLGAVTKKGLQWLITRQKQTGAFDAKDASADAIAVLALCEAYGITANATLKPDAQKGIDRIVATSMKETRGIIWKGMALKSGEISGLHVPAKAYEEVLQAIRSREGETAVAGYTMLSIFVRKNRADVRLAQIRALDPALLETETLYFANLATYQYDGPNGPAWLAWNGPVKNRLLPGQHVAKGACERGSWEGKGFRGRLQATALNGLDFKIYYAYSLPK